VRHLTGHSTTEYRQGLERDPLGHGANLEPKGEGETSMPQKRLRTKTLSLMCRKTCEHGERGSLEPKSPVVQAKANRRASEAVPAPIRFERMEAATLRREGTSGNEPDEGDEWAPTLAEHTAPTELGIPYGTRVLGERSHRSSLSWGKPSTWRRVTGLEASEREGMRDAVSRPQWMSRSRKRYTLKGVCTVWRGAVGTGLVFDTI
jgi:hypothetical protein